MEENGHFCQQQSQKRFAVKSTNFTVDRSEQAHPHMPHIADGGYRLSAASLEPLSCTATIQIQCGGGNLHTNRSNFVDRLPLSDWGLRWWLCPVCLCYCSRRCSCPNHLTCLSYCLQWNAVRIILSNGSYVLTKIYIWYFERPIITNWRLVGNGGHWQTWSPNGTRVIVWL